MNLLWAVSSVVERFYGIEEATGSIPVRSTIEIMEPNKDEKTFEQINSHLARLDKYLTRGWRAFWRGMLSGAGGVVGAAVIIFLIGVILNIVGVIPAFKDYVDGFKAIFEEIRAR